MYSFRFIHFLVLIPILAVGAGLGEAGAESLPYLVKDIHSPLPDGASNPHNLTVIGSVVYFSASDETHGCELWKSDGTEAGTAVVKDILPGGDSSNPQYLVNVNGTLFFAANDGTNGYEVWKSDGTEAGTVLVRDIVSGAGDSFPRYLTASNGKVFFSAWTAANGTELWVSDGTAGGTILQEITAGAGSSSPINLTDVNGMLFCQAAGSGGAELWRCDGAAIKERVLDIYAGATGSSPANLVNVNGTLFFSATDPINGTELWKSDGTPAGTTIVLNINTGTANSSPANLTNVNGTLFFSANDGSTGVELWKSDGTGVGTISVRDINAGAASSSPASLTNVNGTLFFSANNGTSGIELWRSNGTAAGTVIVRDIRSGSSDSSPTNLINVSNVLYFSANEGTNGIELWRSTGTSGSTVLVADIRDGSGSSSPTEMENLNGTLVFRAGNGISGNELWKSTGTEAGTELVKNIETRSGSSDSSSPAYETIMNGNLYFRATDGTTGYELWKSDGTMGGTTPVKDIYPGGSNSSPAYITTVGGGLYFQATDGINGTELWSSDGTEAGTKMVKDINPAGNAAPANLYNLNGTLFFSATDGVNGVELWTSDGTEAGTVMVQDINPTGNSSPANLINFNGTLFFTATDGLRGVELWSSDGTSGGTGMVLDIHPAGNANPSYLTVMNGMLYFQANDGTNGAELWKSDGTAVGTTRVDIRAGASSSSPVHLAVMNNILYFQATNGVTGAELWSYDGTTLVPVADIRAGANSSSPSYLTVMNGMLYFQANEGTNGAELWRSDGVPSGSTVMVKDICAGAFSSSPSAFCEVNGTLFFTATDGMSGTELWKTDGTLAGTTLAREIYTGSGSPGIGYMTNFNNALFFTATDLVYGVELWTSDGTAAGTTLLKDINGVTPGSAITALKEVNDITFFQANDGVNGAELWKTDGTPGGTVLVSDIYPGKYSSTPDQMGTLNGLVYFRANNGTNGQELWRSDGTAAGTTLVKDIYAGSSSGSPAYMTEMNGQLYFRANEGTGGNELWVSDGTSGGTSRLIDIYPGSTASGPAYLTNINGTLYFQANEGANGIELWKSDGTPIGTTLVKNINPGNANSSPSNFTEAGGVVFFTATDGVNGVELWRTDGTDPGTIMVKDIYPGATGSSPTYLVNLNGLLYFRANDGISGNEIWMSDGTDPGTVLFADLLPGNVGSTPSYMCAANGAFYFAASNGLAGYELWMSRGTLATTVLAGDVNPGAGCSNPTGITAMGCRILYAATDGSGIGTELWATDVPPNWTSQNPGPVEVGNGPVTMNASAFVAGSTGLCDVASSEARKLPDGAFGASVVFSCTDVGALVEVEVKAAGDTGQSTTQSVMVSVVDTVAPDLTTLNPGPVNVGSGSATIAKAAFVDSVTDPCDSTVDLAVRRLPDGTFGDDVSFDCADANTTVDVEVRAVDNYSNTTLETVQVSVADSTPPALTTLNPGPVNVGGGPVTIATALFVDSVADPCDATVDLAVRRLPDGTFGNDVSFSCADANTTVDVEVSAVDNYSNTTIETVQVAVVDATAPALTTLNPGPVNVGGGPVTIATALFVDSVTDPCDSTVDLAVRRLPDGSFGDDVSFSCADAGATVDVEVSAVDNYSNTTLQTVQVAVVDTTAPSLTTLDPSPINVGYGSATMTKDDFVESVTDTCDTAVDITLRRLPDGVFDDAVSFDCADADTFVDVEVQAVDEYANATLQTVQVYVEDSNAPILVAKNPGAVNVGNGLATVPTASFVQSVMDYCDSTVETAVRRLPGGTYGDEVSFSCADAGTTVGVQVRALDEYGNTAHWTVQVSVVDTVAPSLTTNNPGPVNAGSGSATVLAPAFVDSATDTCDTPVTVTVRRLPDGEFGESVSFSCADVDTTVDVEVRAADGFNNAVVQTVQVAVVDSIAPVLTTANPGPINIGANDVVLSAEDFLAAIQEPCGVASKELRRAGGTYSAAVTFTCADAGSTVSIELLVTDDSGNTATATVPLSVVDATAPEITRLGDASVIHECSTPYHDLGATASDHCDGNLTAQIAASVPVSETTPPGTYAVRYNVSDNAGNPAVEVTRTVTVVDTQRPAITLLGTPTLIINRRSVFVDPGATAFDDCDGNLTSRIVVGGDTVNTSREADYTLTYNVSDASGNLAPQLTRVVTVVGVGGPPVILVQPQNTSVLYQQNATFSVLPNYDWTLSYRWYKNGFPLSDSTDISGATERILTVLGAENGDEGAYTCVLTNEDGSSTSTAAYLRVQDPAITVQPDNTAVILGAPATFSITAVGTTPIAYQWYKAGSPEIQLNDTAGKISGATTNVLTIQNARKTDQGLYFCKVTGVDGMVWSSSARLYAGDPAIEIQPQSQTSSLGSTVVFEVTARGTWPIYYQWMKNGVNLTNNERISGVLTRTLTITDITGGDAAGYSVVVSGVTSVISSTATLSLGAPPVIDSVVTTPSSGKVHISGYAAFAVITAGGDQPFTYQWYKGGQPLTNDARINGANAPILSISEIEPADAAYYTVQVSNSAGADTSDPARLSVGLQFAKDLSDITVTSGRPVDWPIEITGAIGNISFQWYKVDKETKALVQVYEGGPVSGSATKCLHFIPVAPEHAGDYQVEVSDDFDTVLSGEGTLNVVDGVPLLGMTGLAVLGGMLAALGARKARRRNE